MTPLPAEIQERMNNVAYMYVEILRDEVVKVLSKEKNIDSGALRNSISARIRKATDAAPPALVLKFLDYGEYIGKKKLLWTKLPSVAKLTEWVIRQGYADLSKPVPGYKNGKSFNLSQEKRAARIAWAIAINKKNTDKFRRIPWKKEAFPQVLGRMNTETTKQFAAMMEILFKESLEGINA